MNDIDFLKTKLLIDDYSLSLSSIRIEKKILRLFPIDTLRLIELDNSLIFDHGDVFGETKGYAFSLSIGELKQRMDLLNYNINKASEDFQNAKNKLIEKFERNYSMFGNRDDSNFPLMSPFENSYNKLEYFKKLEFSACRNAIDEVVAKKYKRIIKIYGDKHKSIIPEEISNSLQRYIVCYGMPSLNFSDELNLLRLAIDGCEDNIIVTYFIFGFMESHEPDIHAMYNSLYDDNTFSVRFGLKKIILTEGKTDSELLQKLLKIRYPYLQDLFCFFDFTKKEGSASAVIKNCISLIASGVPNTVIALLDNDFEGKQALKRLKNEIDFIPKNLVVMCYPDLEFAKEYPVKNIETGKIELRNVNGLGCALEMYLGKNQLTVDGKLVPLYEKKNSSQLKFSNNDKNEIQNRFRICIENGISDGLTDLDSILKTMFAYVEKNI